MKRLNSRKLSNAIVIPKKRLLAMLVKNNHQHFLSLDLKNCLLSHNESSLTVKVSTKNILLNPKM